MISTRILVCNWRMRARREFTIRSFPDPHLFHESPNSQLWLLYILMATSSSSVGGLGPFSTVTFLNYCDGLPVDDGLNITYHAL
jgi:hypothetical protein